MADDIRERVARQFSARSPRADVWRLFDRVLPTDAFLNLGYSAWYQPHAVGSCQRRLATRVGERLAAHLPETEGVTLLDVGCGRGGPTAHLAERFGFRTVGLDLVPYNVARARENAAAAADGPDAAFVVGDATRLPFASGSLPACVGVDAFVYVPERDAVFEAVADALEPGGVFVFSDLVRRVGATAAERRAVARFAGAWDMPDLWTPGDYGRALRAARLRLRDVTDLSAHSVGRFRTWTTPVAWLSGGPAGPLLDAALRRADLDADAVTEQVLAAHAALPALRHVLLVAEAPQ